MTINATSRELLLQLQSVISSLPCDYAEARVALNESTGIALSGDEVDSISSGESRGGSIRMFNRGAWSFGSFNDLSGIPARAGALLRRSVALAGTAPGVFSSKPVVAQYATRPARPCGDVSFDEKFGLMRRYNGILKKPSLVQTTRSMYRDSRSIRLYCNTEGTAVSYERSFCGVSFTAIAKDGSLIQPFSESAAGYGGFELAQGREEMAERAAGMAVDLLRAEPVPGGVYDVVIDPHLAGVFIHEAFGHLSEADFIYENDRMKELMAKGRRVGGESLCIIDDGSIEGLTGYIPIDDEGIAPGPAFLVKNGVLCGHLHSRETAYRMDEEPTGNARAISAMAQPIVRMTNTYIENGPNNLDGMLDAAEGGLYVADALGGQTNLEMFTFTAGYGRAIKNGRPGKLYRDVMLSGNTFQTLADIAMIGNDRAMFGGLGGCGKKGQSPLPVSFGGPHILVKNVLIGGRGR
ncbi:MAG TPA: TldD/PmbA family protein [Spirochaetota bacterium]|nr:TldD/PmbA family protein [Spirochaetota bacterium]